MNTLIIKLFSQTNKTAFTLKTPHVVFLSHFLGSSATSIHILERGERQLKQQ